MLSARGAGGQFLPRLFVVLLIEWPEPQRLCMFDFSYILGGLHIFVALFLPSMPFAAGVSCIGC